MQRKMEEKQIIKIENELEVIDVQPKYLTKTIGNVKRGSRKYMYPEQINRVLDCMPAGMHRMLCTFLWKTGVRITEALSIRKKDIDFKNMVITIRWLKSRRYIERNIPMHPTLKEALYYYVSPLNLNDRLFDISRQRAHQITTKWFGHSPHSFRHSFAVNWLRCHGDVTILSRYLGHARLQETVEYLKIVPIDQGKELLKIHFD